MAVCFAHEDSDFTSGLHFDKQSTEADNRKSNFLLFMPTSSQSLKAVLSYYQSAVKLTSEGDVTLSDETIQGLGTAATFLSTILFGAIVQIASPQPTRQDMASFASSPAAELLATQPSLHADDDAQTNLAQETIKTTKLHQIWSVLTSFVPDPGYFLAGGLSGVASRTSTAPLDRLKVYLIAQTGNAQEAVNAAKSGAALQATKHSTRTLVKACQELWAAGGIRSLFAGNIAHFAPCHENLVLTCAGNGLNVLKVMPESAVKFGSYEVKIHPH